MTLRITWTRVIVALLALAVLGFVVAWSGVISIAASSGHWRITDLVLHGAMRKSVRTWAALTVKEPAADASGLVAAAGHYATTCAFCHGAPGVRPSRVMEAATPPAPDLATTVHKWTDTQLHWIVKHGVKLTAMPAWPVQDRDDEVRRMTAFVRRLPRMTPAEYRELAYGRGQLGGVALTRLEEALPDCERCHADDGRDQPDIPVLAGQRRDYLLATLEGYAKGTRRSGVMTAAASRLDAPTMAAIAGHYARLPARLSAFAREGPSTVPAEVATGTADPAQRARYIIEHGLPEVNLPPCSKCHADGKRPHYPLLVGQKASYIAARLRRWRGEQNVVDARKPNESMAMIARRIPEDMIGPLAQYIEQTGLEAASARADASRPTERTGADSVHRRAPAALQPSDQLHR